ncbi:MULTISPECIES: LLM class flavin-dependent oxidoreductase [Aerococcus]|uniref:LLM class flavin-dependent oxidoreductase n=1 Tax=Aerococcus TaxID=1375 RepID=UPI000DCBEBC4|nr:MULTISPECIES: LLM class flavin-dependent oxidoreductase [Aerococcus]KAA9233539.1 LLM class flavin-dependent oxidoreductase [Aerococcus mictus]MBU5610823.1 LLM class flavin-dependent oxidoreductase [Aerococcus urinae]MDK6291605.1 LLM class flavin-dependent oxidoreductase [Aerococcus urinae]MDK6374633.1 LLM class flavin-dependent oxidoreductase [Aerococcus urinae]MDK6421620.1 LLM class flavin-dependent oxidoreductase [Aerococcus urinae]
MTRANPEEKKAKGLEFGLYSLGDNLPNPHTGKQLPASERIEEIIQLGKLAEEAGFDAFQVGESHQDYFVSQSNLIILSAIARETKTIKLGSAVTTLSVLDPVRVYEDAVTIDLLSQGRMEIVAGRASRLGAFELFGYDYKDYEELFEEKIALLKEINDNDTINWQGQFRPDLDGVKVQPRSERTSGKLPIWRGIGNSNDSARRAGLLGMPIYQAHLSGANQTFAHRIKVFREAAQEAGYDPNDIPIQTGSFLYVRENTQQAYQEFWPYVEAGFPLVNGQPFPKRAFAQGQNVKSATMVGDPQLIIDKLLMQYELFGHQRFNGEIDFGGQPFDEIRRTLDLFAEKVIPTVKKYTQA